MLQRLFETLDLCLEDDVSLRARCIKQGHVSIKAAIVDEPKYRDHRCNPTSCGQQDDLFVGPFVETKLPCRPNRLDSKTNGSMIVKESRYEPLLHSFRRYFDVPTLSGRRGDRVRPNNFLA